MKVLRIYNENASPAEIYRMTKNPGVQKLIDMANQKIKLGRWCHYDDGTDEKSKPILTLQDKDTGVLYGTNSVSFINGFIELMDYAAETEMEVSEIFVYCTKSRNGRDFLQCVLPDEDVNDNDNL